ncbi:MAG: HEAT repeat domain-containing protein [Phycisphaerales bacterium]|nr:MAG: HEAT repeat domain-containing protein [Phycisphaerales bacterium]
MRNRPGRLDLQHGKRKFTIVCNAVLLVCLAVSVCGCNEPSVPVITDYGSDNSDPQRAQAFEILSDGLMDTEALVRVHAIEAIVATGQMRLMPTVQRLLTDESMPVRFAAAVALGDLEYAIARTSVSRALRDPEHNVVVAASYAMGRLGDTEYYEVVRKALSSSDQTVRANAAFLLGRIGDPRSIDLLKQVQQHRTSVDKVRFQALEARAELGDTTVLNKLWAMVYGYSEDRMIGVRAMGALGNAKAKEILVTKLDDDMLEVRLAAAEQLGKLRDITGEPEVLDVFEKNLTAGLDEQALERTKVLTAMAIGQICTPALTKHLPGLTKDKSKSVRIAAAKAVLLCRAR